MDYSDPLTSCLFSYKSGKYRAQCARCPWDKRWPTRKERNDEAHRHSLYCPNGTGIFRGQPEPSGPPKRKPSSNQLTTDDIPPY